MFLTRWLRKRTTAIVTPKLSIEPLADRITPARFGFGHSLGMVATAPPMFLQARSEEEAPPEMGRHGFGRHAQPFEVDATALDVNARGAATVGETVQLTIVAVDANGMPDFNYTGTVSLTSSDEAATLPEAYIFTTADHGRHTFGITLATQGETTITATDAGNAAIMGSATLTVVAAPVVESLRLVTASTAYSGSATPLLVAAVDSGNHIVKNYEGTVTFSSNDPDAVLPTDTTFSAQDRGFQLVNFTPTAIGETTLTATDTASGEIVGTTTVNVTAAPVATHLVVVAQPAVQAGVPT